MISLLFLLVTQVQAVPLEDSRWVALSFNKIPKSQVAFKEGSMVVSVDKSAGPLVHKLDQPAALKSIRVKGEWKGSKKVESGPFDEDSILRVGLVVLGDKKLNAVKRLFAADWVKKLFALAPAGAGLDKIYFFNLTNREDMIGKKREHPKSDLIVERIEKAVAAEGKFDWEIQVSPPLNTAALWLSIDGDDTGSAFELTIRELVLEGDQPVAIQDLNLAPVLPN